MSDAAVCSYTGSDAEPRNVTPVHNSESLVRQSYEFQVQRQSRIQISVIEENPTTRPIISTATVRTRRDDVNQQSTLHTDAVVYTPTATSSAPPSYEDCVGFPPSVEAGNTSKSQWSPLPTYREYVARNLCQCKSCVNSRSTAMTTAPLSHDGNVSRQQSLDNCTASGERSHPSIANGTAPRTTTGTACLTSTTSADRPHRDRVFLHPLMNEGPAISPPTPSTSNLPTYVEYVTGSRSHGNSLPDYTTVTRYALRRF